MSTCDLTGKKCVPCEGGVPKLTQEEIEKLRPQVPGWKVEGDQLKKHFEMKDFKAIMAFVNKAADLAEEEGHHPDFLVHGWNKVDFTIWTHAIGGLSENDFILAAKIDRLAK